MLGTNDMHIITTLTVEGNHDLEQQLWDKLSNSDTDCYDIRDGIYQVIY